ncbi:palmitoyltransferase ZDHHC7 [Tribolium madens]|uniref:palmitoyltransferase ZDHHC7 n=1 Tax=Tribolium madens TaxID=41895 RepID=UPI001CF7382D|nr:palmitoyltransferase ZDHHC7 [Tribolium madens]
MFLKDPCGVCCILITYVSVFYADYVIVKWVVLQSMVNSLWGSFNVVMFNTVILFLCMAHFRAVFTDPGTLPLFPSKLDFSDLHSSESGCDYVDWTVCTRCEIYRPPRAHHCRICRRCIRRMDHHCPWINNCVGERNQKYFLQFLIYVGILSVYAIVLVSTSWLSECKDCSQEITIKQARIMHSVILLLISTLFGMFVSAILVDQIQAIVTDETAVEQVQNQGPYRPHKPKMTLLSDVFGREHPLFWLMPCSSTKRKLDTPLINHHV